MYKGRDAIGPPVEARAGQQVVALHASPKCPARQPIEIVRGVVGARKAGDDANMAGYVLVELRVEPVVADFLRNEVNPLAIERGAAILVKAVGVVAGALVSVPDVEFIERIIVTTILGQRCGCAHQSDEEQEKDS